jgi:hypothetical protein
MITVALLKTVFNFILAVERRGAGLETRPTNAC